MRGNFGPLHDLSHHQRSKVQSLKCIVALGLVARRDSDCQYHSNSRGVMLILE